MPRTASPNSRVFRHDAPKSADILASFQRFYFDTALSSSPAALPSLKSFAKNGRTLFGSDFPFDPPTNQRQCVVSASASRRDASKRQSESEYDRLTKWGSNKSTTVNIKSPPA